MPSLKLRPLIVALGLALSVAGPAAPPAPRALELQGIKLQWSGGGEEQLPSWLSARFSVAADGRLEGRVVELALSDDGTDEDGDPAGFDSWVFESGDGSLKDLRFDGASFSFSAALPEEPGWTFTCAGHLSDPASGLWVISAVSKGPHDLSMGKNRFPLVSDSKDGVLSVYPQPQDDGQGKDGISL